MNVTCCECSLLHVACLLMQIPVTRLDPFEQFTDNYHPLQMKGVYKRAVIAAIKVRLIQNLLGTHIYIIVRDRVQGLYAI